MSNNPELGVKYMGLNLTSPVLASSSDFTSNISEIQELAKAGAGAVVLKSLFEEQIIMETDSMRMNNMFDTYSYNEDYIAYYSRKHEVGKYLDLIAEAKKTTDIPVIASIHCSSADTWMSFASEIEKAGADALELNVFILPSDPAMKDHEIKATYHSIVDGVRAHTKLPIALKSHWYFTDMASFYTEMSHKVDSLVLFNRFFSPDIDIKNRKVISSGSISSPSDHAQVLRWIGILAGKVASSLSASGGIHNAEAVIKSLLAGADVVQIASALYIRRDGVIPSMLEGLSNWMKEQGISSIDEFRGSLSHQNITNPLLYERAQFMKYFSDFRSK